MLQELRKFIEDKQLFSPNHKLLLAISGGIDSVVLFDSLLKLGYSFSVAHCNFGLRGIESDEDELFVNNLAIKNRISFHTKRFDTTGFASQQAYSIQMAARELRYQWFNTLLSEYNYDFLLTAHHLNDIVETLLINLSRGTGISGLHGISEKKGRIVRPLLFTGREEIRSYAEEQALSWREDSSNVEEKYARNLIRHRVVPTLKTLNPSLETTFKLTTERIKGVEETFKYFVEQNKSVWMKTTAQGIEISIPQLNAFPSPAAILHELIGLYGFSYSTVQQIISSSVSGKMWYGTGYRLLKDRTHWIVTPITSVDWKPLSIYSIEETISTPSGEIHFNIYSKSEYSIIRGNKNIAQLDLDSIVFPITLRLWDSGDKFMPLGMRQFKKISDFFIDTKVSIAQKEATLLFTSKNDIFWVMGWRIDDRYKITDNTQKILVIEYHPRIVESSGTKDNLL